MEKIKETNLQKTIRKAMEEIELAEASYRQAAELCYSGSGSKLMA